jgi:hypothetical protein
MLLHYSYLLKKKKNVFNLKKKLFIYLYIIQIHK